MKKGIKFSVVKRDNPEMADLPESAPQGGLAFPPERRGDSFTHYEADAI